MKNIEKYTNTKDALEAYNQPKSESVPFDEWLECEYEEPSVPSLLEAAKAVTTLWFEKGQKGSLAEISRRVCALSSAIDREKRKPVRNCDKYRTAEEAHVAFAEFCGKNECRICRFGDSTRTAGCVLEWLYEKAGKEAE